MNLLSWNCQGLGNSRAVRVLRDILRSHQPNFLFLSETLSVGSKIAELSLKLGFSNFFAVDKHGRGGGLAAMWKHTMVCQVVGSSQNHIDVAVKESNNVSWRLSCYYGFPERERRQEAWDFLRSLATNSQAPWCVIGDFNDILYSYDKKGRHPHPQRYMNGFKQAIEDCSLIEIDLLGGRYTWEKSKGTADWVRERLDRAFATESWWQLFLLCTLSVFHATVSDHEPIKLALVNTTVTRKDFRFRFENTWLKDATFHSDVSKFWRDLPTSHLLPKLISVSSFMARWGRNFFQIFRDKLLKQKEILDLLKDREDDDGIQMYFDEKAKLNDLLLHEEIY